MTVRIVPAGGGVREAVHAGMLKARFENGIRPDAIVGAPIGTIAGAAVAAEPRCEVIDRVTEVWSSPAARAVHADLEQTAVRWPDTTQARIDRAYADVRDYLAED